MNTLQRLAVLHPGAMGASVGAAAREAGLNVGWLDLGRSAATRSRARQAGLTAYADLATLLNECECLIVLCPPSAALEIATSVAAIGFGGLYVDANAVAARTAARIAETVTAAGAEYVDGGVIGPPPTAPGTTRLYLSGPAAARVAACFAGSRLEAVDIGAERYAASNLKMCYAAWSKGSSALLLAVAALAESSGVATALGSEWRRSQPGLLERVARDSAASAPKAWRFIAEMEEIAATFADHGLPAGFHRGAADLYAAVAAVEAAGLDDTNDLIAQLAATSAR